MCVMGHGNTTQQDCHYTFEKPGKVNRHEDENVFLIVYYKKC